MPPNQYLEEKGVDVMIAAHVIMKAVREEYDWAFLVSGDTDLVEAVRAVRSLGKRVQFTYFPRGYSSQLKHACDTVLNLSLRWMSGTILPAGREAFNNKVREETARAAASRRSRRG